MQFGITQVFVWLLSCTSTPMLPLNSTWREQEPSKQKNCLAIECNCAFSKVSLCLIRIINHAASLFSKSPPSSRRSRWDCGMVRKTKALITLLRLQSVKSTTWRSQGRPSQKPSFTGWSPRVGKVNLANFASYGRLHLTSLDVNHFIAL